MLNVLFSGHHGLISWHPMVLFGFIGIPLVWSRSRGLAVGLAIVVVLYWYVNASIYSWWGGVSFGMRRFVGVLPFFSIGIAAMGDYVFREKRPRGWFRPLALLLCLSLYNGALASAYREHHVTPGGPVSFANVWASMIDRVHWTYGNPLAYPANLLFALEYGAALGQYDFLSSDPIRLDRFSVKGFEVRRYLGRGWIGNKMYSRVSNSTVVAVEQSCEILLPLRGNKNYVLRARMSLPVRFGKLQRITFRLNGEEIKVVTIEPRRTNEIVLKLDRDKIEHGLNRLELDFEESKVFPSFRWTRSSGRGLSVATLKGLEIFGALDELHLREDRK
jgi:hypothetical protein